jgi:hypothetical protein
MNPDYQAGPAPAPPEKPVSYDFINNPPKPPKKSLFSGGGGKSTWIILAGGIGLFSVILLLGSLIFSGDSDKTALLEVAKKQNEIIAITDVGEKDAGTNQAESLALAVKLVITTEQRELVAIMYKNGKVKEKEFAADISADTAAQLENAQKNGRFDEVFTNVIQEELTEYQRELKTANGAVSGPKAKALLAKDFDSAGILLSIPSN